MLVRTRAAEVERRSILRGAFLHQARDLHLAQARRHLLQLIDVQRRRDLVEQIIELGDADDFEHLADVGFGMRNEGHRKTRNSENEGSIRRTMHRIA